MSRFNGFQCDFCNYATRGAQAWNPSEKHLGDYYVGAFRLVRPPADWIVTQFIIDEELQQFHFCHPLCVSEFFRIHEEQLFDAVEPVKDTAAAEKEVEPEALEDESRTEDESAGI